MKNLFKHFNDIDIDVNEFEQVDVTEFEKAQYKKDLKSKVSKTKSRIWMKSAAAVCLTLGISTASIVGLSYTTFAQEIPIINSIIKLFSDKEQTLTDAKEFVAPLNLENESNGITITINESLFDSQKFYVGYSIETDKDLGENPRIKGGFKLNGQEYALHQDDYHLIEKVGENQYAGLSTAILPITNLLQEDTSLQEANFEFFITNLTSEDQTEIIDGNWNFELYAEAVENSVQFVEGISQQEDLSVKLNKITYTPFSFTVNFHESIQNESLKENYIMIVSYLDAKDDLGNKYSSRPNGGIGFEEGEKDMSTTFGKLHPNAKKLIFTPHFKLWKADSDNFEIIELEEIIVEIGK